MALAGCTQQGGSDSEDTTTTADDGDSGGNGDGSDDTPEEEELSGTIEIAGSSTVFPLAEAMAAEFRKDHPNVEFNIRSTGSGGGFKNWFCPGETQFNNASRPIKDSEMQNCQDNGIEPIEMKVATDALTVVVNNNADWVDCVTVEELKRIWEPDGASRWSDVRDDWPDEEFELFGAASTSGTFDYFTEVIVGEEGSHREDYSPTEQDRQIVQGVRGSDYGMGYFGFSYYFNNPDQVKALEVDGGDGCVLPSLETASSGEYTPLSRPLFTYPKKEALSIPQVREFARFFIENSTSERIVAEQVGYVPNTESAMQENLDRLESAIQDVA